MVAFLFLCFFALEGRTLWNSRLLHRLTGAFPPGHKLTLEVRLTELALARLKPMIPGVMICPDNPPPHLTQQFFRVCRAPRL